MGSVDPLFPMSAKTLLLRLLKEGGYYANFCVVIPRDYKDGNIAGVELGVLLFDPISEDQVQLAYSSVDDPVSMDLLSNEFADFVYNEAVWILRDLLEEEFPIYKDNGGVTSFEVAEHYAAVLNSWLRKASKRYDGSKPSELDENDN